MQAASSLPPVAILCGGRGTRLRERTETVPKALVEIGGMPILWHVIGIYAAQGFRRFILCTGYLGEMVAEFAATETWPEGVTVKCVETGADTQTGGRIHAIRALVGEGSLCVTYADGVADIDLGALLASHREHGRVATVTVVRPRLQWGLAMIDENDRVEGFIEKPLLDDWINGGFFCFEPAVFDYLKENSVLEHEPLEGLAADGQLSAYRHEGFWDCMDTYKDAVALNDLWETGDAPWLRRAVG